MERLPHRVKVERTPEQQAERVARDDEIRRAVEGGFDRLEPAAGEGSETVSTESRREAGTPAWPAKGVVALLRAERLRLGLSLADVADHMGADRGAVHKIEIGLNRNPTFDTLDRYAAALGMTFGLTRDRETDPADTVNDQLPHRKRQRVVDVDG